jgi:hypothetical protein
MPIFVTQLSDSVHWHSVPICRFPLDRAMVRCGTEAKYQSVLSYHIHVLLSGQAQMRLQKLTHRSLSVAMSNSSTSKTEGSTDQDRTCCKWTAYLQVSQDLREEDSQPSPMNALEPYQTATRRFLDFSTPQYTAALRPLLSDLGACSLVDMVRHHSCSAES